MALNLLLGNNNWYIIYIICCYIIDFIEQNGKLGLTFVGLGEFVGYLQ